MGSHSLSHNAATSSTNSNYTFKKRLELDRQKYIIRFGFGMRCVQSRNRRKKEEKYIESFSINSSVLHRFSLNNE